MSAIMEIINATRGNCACGVKHETTIKDIRIGSGLVHQVGAILKENGFPKSILLVADQNTLKAADGILESLEGFAVELHIYDNLRVADMIHVAELEEKIKGREVAILSVGTGSVNDPCRLAAARQNKMLCIFASAPSMDGFASYSSPLVEKGFKASYPAKSPEVIIGDTKILANAPSELKSAGFGDMVSKYVALIDWQVSTLITGEYYCEKVAALTRQAIDELMVLADKVTENDEETAGKIFEALLKTGIGMSYTQNSRPASGAEHIISHVIECKELIDGIIPNYHGDDVGVCTLETLKFYDALAQRAQIDTRYEDVDWDAVYRFYGPMAQDVRKLNEPENIIDLVDPKKLKESWDQIRKIIRSVPSYEECKAAMKKAGCKITVADIGKNEAFFRECMYYSPFMRKRMTLLRMRYMIV
ncbi:MAG: iron-containing alcohol dehydrogenase [Oscillospiraceae bacterium]|nr:iron-containing alcohol dehydrogenase [Oscillospiraceae bacterium]